MGKKNNYGGSEDSPDACFGAPGSPILDTGDGRWLAPVSTWPSWHGDKEGDDRWECVAFVSPDEGATWPDFVTLYSGAMEDGTSCDDLIFWCALPRPPHHICASTVLN